MKYWTCPFCGKNDIPDGATVCSGCQAEIMYEDTFSGAGPLIAISYIPLVFFGLLAWIFSSWFLLVPGIFLAAVIYYPLMLFGAFLGKPVRKAKFERGYYQHDPLGFDRWGNRY